jgi:hypothetical protein
MSELSVIEKPITSMTEVEIDKVRQLENELLKMPQVKIATQHIIHAGMYARTIIVPKGVVLTGALMKIPTLLIIQGDFLLFAGDKTITLNGYHIFTGAAMRKQAGVALSDTFVTMIFPTKVKTVKEAEEEFTDEAAGLFSRYDDAINHVKITEE